MSGTNPLIVFNAELIDAAVTQANALDRPLFVVVIGTRPCYIKLASLISALGNRKVPHVVVESGQHYDSLLTGAKQELGYAHAIAVTLNIQGSLTTLSAQIYQRVVLLADLFRTYKPKHCPIPIVSGDTLTAGLLPQAWYLHAGVRSVHIEAGLRTLGPVGIERSHNYSEPESQRSSRWTLMRDEPFPEALCSRLASAASQLLFAPVDRNREALVQEGFDDSQIFVVGSLSADAVVLGAHDLGEYQESPLPDDSWLRVDLHRRENMTSDRIRAVLGGMERLNRRGIRSVLILSNALRHALDRFGLWWMVENIKLAGGQVQGAWASYQSVVAFLKSSNCLAIYTDSGGLQEEACILGTPSFTCRFGTDRSETILDFASNLLIPPISAESVDLGISSALARGVAARSADTFSRSPYGMNVGDTIAQILHTWSPMRPVTF